MCLLFIEFFCVSIMFGQDLIKQEEDKDFDFEDSLEGF